MFRDPMVYLGYHMRQESALIYIVLLILLTIVYVALISNSKKIHPLALAVITGLILICSNPLFSHDLFSYIFDAKILTHYGQNPYTTIPESFPGDEWLRFMHWTHRSYPNGPTFLPLTLVPSFLGMGIFILNFMLFKAVFVGSYIIGVFLLQKIDKKGALFFATHPLVLIEGLVNAHNDMIAVSLGLVGVYLLFQKKQIVSRLFLVASAGIKYLSAPILILTRNNKTINTLALLAQVALILYLSFTRRIQPWYFLPLFVFVPYFLNVLQNLHIFFFSLLLSYVPYIRYGDWNAQLLDMKHDIMIVGAAVNAVYFLYVYWPRLRGYLLRK
jgi:hypothetical protein